MAPRNKTQTFTARIVAPALLSAVVLTNAAMAQDSHSHAATAEPGERAGENREGFDGALPGREGGDGGGLRPSIRLRERRQRGGNGPALRERRAGEQRHHRPDAAADRDLRGAAGRKPETDRRRLPGVRQRVGRRPFGPAAAYGTAVSPL